MNTATETKAADTPARMPANTRNDGKGHNMSHPGGQGKMSIFRGVKAFKPHGEITLVNFAKDARDGAHRKAVESYRTALMLEDPDAAEMKKRLEAVTVSGTVTSGVRKEAAEEGRFNHNGILQVDIDGVKNPGQIRDMIASDSHITFASVSPSEDGVKAFMFIPVCKSRDEHLAAFAAMQEHMKETYDITIDASTSDTARLCFVLYDPEAKWNANAVPLVIPEPQEAPPQAAKPQVDVPPPRADGGFSLAETPEDIRALLAAIPPRPEYMEWLTVCSAVWDALGEIGGTLLLQEWSPEESAGEYANKFKDRLKNVHAGTLVSLAKANGFDTRHAAAAKHAERDGPSPRVKGPWERQAAPGDGGKAAEGDPKTLRERAYAMRFDPNETPPPDETCMVIGDVPIAARGNLTVPQGKSKVGKSALISAILGAAHRGNHYAKGDTLCVEWQGDSTGAIIHMDTEQSPSDWHALVRRGITRSGLPETSPRLVSLPLVLFSRSERLTILKETLAFERDDKGMIDLVLVDGVADLCVSPNDEAEALELVSQLHALAQEFNCPIVCVLHENPSTDQGKTRGHLGSELNRKAFANLRIDKDTETSISTIYGTDMRKRDIPKEQGFCFAWDEATGMHTFQGRAAGVKAAQTEAKAVAKARAEWKEIFDFAAASGTFSLVPLVSPKQASELERDMSGTKELTKEATMKKRMQRAETLGVLRKTDLLHWTLAPAGQAGQERDK
jgi:hypothetical protein